MLTFDNVHKAYGSQVIIRAGSFHVSAGERIGLVGANGAGKSTLFNLILGLEEPDAGSIHRTKNLAIGHLPQEVGRVGDDPLLEMVMAYAQDLSEIETELAVVSAELGQAGDPAELEVLTRRQGQLLERFEDLDGYTLRSRAEKILEGLGFTSERFDRPVDELSGGWRMRALLARILLADPDLILLDEPTNHLDLSSMLWLENYLTELTATVIIVSHDRTFLNRTAMRIVELERGRLGVYSGNYDSFEKEKTQQLVHLEAAWRNQQEKIRQMKQFIDRNRSRKDRANQVQARLKALEKMDLIHLPETERSFSFSFPPPNRPPATLISLENIDLSYDGITPVYSGLTARVERESRVALVGPNGAGKSTLLKVLAGALHPDRGTRECPASVGLAYYAQHQLDQLHPHLTVIEELMSVSGDASQTQMRTLLGSFLFSGDEVFKKVSVLSGGEKSRLALCKLLFSGANLLLLDEPTNHLDIPSRIALEGALKAWPGEMVLVTHDRRLINAVATTIWEVSPGGSVEAFPGNLDDYVSTWSKMRTGQTGGPTAPDKPRAGSSKPGNNRERKRREARQRQELHRLTKDLKARLAGLEQAVADGEAELDRLMEKLADPAVYDRPAEAAELNRRLAVARAELESRSDEWTEAALELEEITENFRKD